MITIDALLTFMTTIDERATSRDSVDVEDDTGHRFRLAGLRYDPATGALVFLLGEEQS